MLNFSRLRKDGQSKVSDGEYWRRVVPSPEPHRIFEMRLFHWLLEKGTIVICAGGGGIPTIFNSEGNLEGVEVVIDKDRASSLLAFELEADLLIMATDADGVYLNWGTDDAEKISTTNPDEIGKYEFEEGSMGPKVEAACDFVETDWTASSHWVISRFTGDGGGSRRDPIRHRMTYFQAKPFMVAIRRRSRRRDAP